MNVWRGVIDRYRKFLPVSEKTHVVSLSEGNTPLIRAHNLEKFIGGSFEIWLKYEGLNVVVGEYISDLLVDDKVIVDTKVIDAVSNAGIGQVMNYLPIAKLELGIILNSRRPKLESRRVVLSD